MVKSTGSDGPKTTKGITNAHWTGTTIIGGSLVLGVILAVVHDRIYAHFSKQVVSSQTQQQWLGRVGTGLAFLIKTLFTASVGGASVQLLWWTLRNRVTSLGSIDTALNIVNNPFAATNLRVFRELPVIVMLAIISWLIPLAAVIAPPTLTVHQASLQGQSTTSIPVPALNFSTSFSTFDPRSAYWTGSQTNIYRTTLSVVFDSRPFPLNAPFPNSSYALTFYGPDLRCQNANQTWYEAATAAGNAYDGEVRLWYAGWIPYTSPGVPTNLTQYVVDMPSSNPTLYVDEYSPEKAQLFLAAWNYTGGTSVTSVYECSLYNSSYTIDFQFTNGLSTPTIQARSIVNPVAFPNAQLGHDNATTSYIALLDALGRILLGTTTSVFTDIAESGTILTKTPLVTTTDFDGIWFAEGNGAPLNMSLGAAVEQVMMNMTLSLFTQSQYLLDSSSLPRVDVTVFENQNVYRYTQWQLLLAYGLAALFSLLGVLIGFWCISVNGASFSNNFTTIVRVVRDSRFGDVIGDVDTSGADPTPERLGKTKVRLLMRAEGEDGLPSYAISPVYE